MVEEIIQAVCSNEAASARQEHLHVVGCDLMDASGLTDDWLKSG